MPIAETFERCKESLKNPKVWIPLLVVAVVIFVIVCGVVVNNRHRKAINKPSNVTEKSTGNGVNSNISSTLPLETTQESEVKTNIVLLGESAVTDNSTEKGSKKEHRRR